MSQAVERRTPQQELVASVRSEHFIEQVSLALPESVSAQRFVRVALTALQANPNLAELERASVIRSLLGSAAMGLLPDGREAAIVPFKGKAQLVPMIAGYRLIAGEYGWTIYTAVVYEKDEFEHEVGLDVTFRHRPVRPGAERGNPIAAYALGKHRDGRREVEVLTVEEVEKVRATSQTATRADAPWTQWWEQMAEKTAGKRLFKKLPLSEDDKRVRIVRAAMEPAEAAAAIYGPSARAAFERVDSETGEILPAREEPADAGGRPAVSPDRQQAEEAATSPDPDPAASSVPDDDDYRPEAEDTSSFSGQLPLEAQELQAKASEAGKAVVPSNRPELKGKTIAEVAAMGTVNKVSGEEYIRWMLHPSRQWEENPDRKEILTAVRTYTEIMLPDLWAECEAANAQES